MRFCGEFFEVIMAGVAILLDILQKSSSVSGRSLHSYGSFGAKAAVSAIAAAAAAAASFTAGRPLRSGILFGYVLVRFFLRFCSLIEHIV